MDFLYNERVGQRIKKLRKDKKISMARLGELVKLHESTINRYEQGKIKSLDIDKIKDFAKALDTTPAYLMGWDEDKRTVRDHFSINLKKIMRLHNTSVSQLAESLNINVNDIISWLDTSAVPELNEVQKIANYYGIPVEDFKNDNFSYTEILSDDEFKLLKMYRDMTAVNKSAVFNLVKSLSENK